MLNNVCIGGRLTRDPELRYTNNNTPVTTFTLAVDRNFTNKATGKRDVDFIDCVAWRNTAEFCSKYFHKGDMATVQGSLQIRNYTDKNNIQRRAAEIIVSSIYFCSPNRSQRQGQNNNGAPQDSYGNAPALQKQGYQQNGYGYNQSQQRQQAPQSQPVQHPFATSPFIEIVEQNDDELPF